MRSVVFVSLLLLQLACFCTSSYIFEQDILIDQHNRSDDCGLRMSSFSASYPNSLQHPELATTKEFHGTQIVDKFAWLEDPNSASVKAWVDSQNSVTESFLKQLEYGPKITDRYVLPQ
jgi:hypothetical protein